MWLWCELVTFIEAVNILQNTDSATCRPLQSEVCGGFGVSEVVIQILEVEVHRFVECLWKRRTSGRWPITILLHIEAVQEPTEPVHVSSGSR